MDHDNSTASTAASVKPKAVNDTNFEDEVMRASGAVLVDFWAEWCPPCKALGPVLDELSQEMAGKVTIVKVNVEESPMISSKVGITQIPSLKIYKDGKLVVSRLGGLPKAQLKQWIESAL